MRTFVPVVRKLAGK